VRELTSQEFAVVKLLGEAASVAAALPELHSADMPEFAHHTHVLQNIIYARPAFETEKKKWSTS
jgi:hypothetical protein